MDNVPVGSFILWGSDTIPSKYLLVNQASLSRTTYSELFSVIGTAFGAADDDHFYLPPSGVFIRITAGGSSNDPDRDSRWASHNGGNTGDNVGSFQGDQLKSHDHTFYRPLGDQGWTNGTDYNTWWGWFHDQVQTTQSTGGNETRPKNVNFNLIVKYTA